MSEAGDFSADILHLFCVLALGQQAEQNCLSALFSDSMFSGTLIHTVTLTLVRCGLLSRVVSHPSGNRNGPCLASEIRQELMHSGWKRDVESGAEGGADAIISNG